MKTKMKKIAAWLLALLLVLQMVPAMAEEQKVVSGTQGPITSYRDKLDIIAITSTITVGDTIQLSTTDNYENISWKSDNETIAEVTDRGLLTANAPGQVKITASEDIYSDSITIRVIGGSSEEEETGASEKLVIIINGSKEKITYDGQEHKLSYTVYCSTEGFDENKLHLLSEDHLASGTECGVYTDGLTKDDFSYDGSEEVEFVITNGWLQIKPATISIYVNNAEKFEGEDDPVFTAEVVGLQGEDTVESLNLTYNVSEDGVITAVIPQDGIINGHYRVDTKKSMAGKLTIKQMNNFPLYNLAVINNTWYRLGKTTIATEKTLDKYVAGLKPANVKVVNAAEYQADLYNFEDLEIEVSGKKYVYKCEKNSEAIILGANYYTASLKNVEAVKEEIGGMNGNTTRWLVPLEDRYDDVNATDSFHMNYTITLHKNKSTVEQQTVYNMLIVNGSSDYYKLRTTSITAQPMNSYKEGKIDAGEYILEKYDFSNVVLKIGDVEYKYNDGSLDQYENYFTVEFENVYKNKMFNRNVTWFNNPDSWLDGAYEEYGNLPNNTKAIHANYKATTHKGVAPERSVTITSDWNGGLGYIGLKITLTSHLTGFTAGKYTLQWQYSTDGENWTNQEGATGDTFTYELNEITTHYSWRVVAYDVK